MYIVKNVPLIPQDQDNSCWYASAQMVIQWRRELTQSCEVGIVDPSEDPPSVAIYKANNGLSDRQIVTLALALGLEIVPPMTPTPQALQNWLAHYGPLWTNGATHITVLVGIDLSDNTVFIHNPLPVGVGKREWRPLSWLVGDNYDSLDPKTNAGVFLHCPSA